MKQKHFDTPAVAPVEISVKEMVNIDAKAVPVVDLSDCGTKKGCFRSPPGCAKQDCRHIVTWKPIDEKEVEFEVDAMLTKDEQDQNSWVWTAVGFSYDKDMVRLRL